MASLERDRGELTGARNAGKHRSMGHPSFQPRQSFLPYRKIVERGGAGDPFEGRIVEHLRPSAPEPSFVVYWAQAHRRIERNLALDFAITKANELGLPVVVYESLRPDYPEANDRIHAFILQGVVRNRDDAARRNLRYLFFLPRSRAESRGALRLLVSKTACLVTDEYPTFILREQTRSFIESSPVSVYTVDHNGVLPMRLFGKEKYSAKFFRDDAHRLLPDRYAAVPNARAKIAPYGGKLPLPDWDEGDIAKAVAACEIDHSVHPVESVGGREEGLRRLDRFITSRLAGYAAKRNREADRTSELSPYLHFGFVGAHEIFERVLLADAPKIDIDAFLEEAIIRRELSFNFCFHRENHRSIDALPEWAQNTLAKHADDRRSPLYTREELERGATYDEVWNLAHAGLLETGTIHNYLRMLWGKKILEWSATAEEAIETMEYLHERYAIDGRDPNTHAGVLWCLGKHDRAWAPERPIFGMVRYMSSESTKRKVDLRSYARRVRSSRASHTGSEAQTGFDG
jgi:deoxyribodipyrimidine photo-lyase